MCSSYLKLYTHFSYIRHFTLDNCAGVTTLALIFGDLLSAVTLYCGPFNNLDGAFAGFNNSSVLPEA